jgi:transposase
MSNVLSEEKKQQVIALGKLGWSLRRIQQATGVRRETASAYLKAAGVEVYRPGWGRRAPAKPAIEVTPGFIAPFSRKPTVPSVCEAYRDLIEQALDRGRNGKAIWQDLVSEHGFTGSYQAVKRFVQKLRGPQRPEPAGIILTAPGEEAQVDYSSGPMVRDPQSGKYRRTRLFVLTLGYSRKSVRLLAWRSSTRIWAEPHEKAFRRLGGCPRVIVLDNLKEGVAVPDIHDPTVNPLFRDVKKLR